jgi:hypothetical protein
VPIGSFQTLQHRAATCSSPSNSPSCPMFATWRADFDSARSAATAVAAAKVQIGQIRQVMAAVDPASRAARQ